LGKKFIGFKRSMENEMNTILAATKKVLKYKDDIIKRGLYEKDEINYLELENLLILKMLLAKEGKLRTKEQIKFIRKCFATFDIFK
jgi:hypothetical protein